MVRLHRTLLGVLCVALPMAVVAAEPPAGTYKVFFPLGGGNQPLWLLKLESKDDKWTGAVTPAPGFESKAKIDAVKVDKGTLRFSLHEGEVAFTFEGKLPGAKSGRILGTVSAKNDVNPAILEPTTLTSLDPFEVSRETLSKSSEGVEVTEAALICLSKAEAKKAKPDDAKAWAEKGVKAAEPFGPKWKRVVVLQIAEVLTAQDGFAGLALEYAQEAEKTFDLASESPAMQKRILTVLGDAYDKAGQKENASKVRERNDRIAGVVIKPYAGRKAKSDRVVLVEMFTCAQHPACVAVEQTAAALQQTYKPTEVVVLDYHVNAPGSDPLSCPESDARMKFYQLQRRSPMTIFDGTIPSPAGGSSAESQARYDEFTRALGDLLEKPAKARLTTTASRKGNNVAIKVNVTDLPEVGPDVRLRVALVEDDVTYTGANKLSEHINVVRFFPSGAAGTAMKTKTAAESYTVDLDMLRTNLKAYQDKTNQTQAFPSKDRPLDLKKLRVIAFVQNDETGEVLNAVQVDVKDE